MTDLYYWQRNLTTVISFAMGASPSMTGKITWTKICLTGLPVDFQYAGQDQTHTSRNVKMYPITKTYLYNFDPLKPHCYIVKLGFTGVDIIFLISAQKHRVWVLVRTASWRREAVLTSTLPPWGGSNEYPQSVIWAEKWKISEVFIWFFFFFFFLGGGGG